MAAPVLLRTKALAYQLASTPLAAHASDPATRPRRLIGRTCPFLRPSSTLHARGRARSAKRSLGSGKIDQGSPTAALSRSSSAANAGEIFMAAKGTATAAKQS